MTVLERIEYEVARIDGDYAHLKNKSNGEEILVAMALLPEETDEGITLIYENFTYTAI